LIDQTFAHHAKFLSAAGLRLDDLQTEFVQLNSQQKHKFGRSRRAFFLYVCTGEIILCRKGFPNRKLGQGTAVGLEKSIDSMVKLDGNTDGARIFISSVPDRHAFIQKLPQELLIITVQDKPFSDIIAATMTVIETAFLSAPPDQAVVRRLCEIIMLQLLRLVQSQVSQSNSAPAGIQHDAPLLQAWTAFLSDPSQDWTIAKLADASGLSRTAFISRFKQAFQAPPMVVLTRIRLEQAKSFLATSGATIQEISFSVGYKSEAAFIRAFKREFQKTPGQYRDETLP